MDDNPYIITDIQGRTWEYTIEKSGHSWEVCCWTMDNKCHWNKYFKTYEAAKAEFERWRK